MPSISKIFEKLLQKRINGHVNSFYLLVHAAVGEIIDTVSIKLEKGLILDNKGFGVVVSVNLPKAFDTVEQDLVNCKTSRLGF